MFVILFLEAFDAVFSARVSAFSLPFIDEWPGIHINLIKLPLVRCAEMVR